MNLDFLNNIWTGETPETPLKPEGVSAVKSDNNNKIKHIDEVKHLKHLKHQKNKEFEKNGKSEAFPLPCQRMKCCHHQGGRCRYKDDHGPVSKLDACPMLSGYRPEIEAHPALEALARQRRTPGVVSGSGGSIKC